MIPPPFPARPTLGRAGRRVLPFGLHLVFVELYEKIAKVLTDPKEHQTRLVDKLRASGGLLVAHGLGSGKTLSSINAKDALGVNSDVVVPAPLQANYDKELVKHLGKRPQDVRVRSYEKAVKDNDLDTSGLVVFDEAHRGRNAGTGAAKLMEQARDARYRMFLTGTPVYNQPHDIANLLNAAAGRKVLPDDPALFKQTFIGEKTVEAPLWDRLKGRVLGHPVDTETHPTLINRDRLVNAAKGYVDVYRGGGEGFPDRIDEEYRVTMSPEQAKYYRFAEGQMPWYLRAKVRAGLPMNKQESKELNAFQGALRQISNTPRGFNTELTDDDEHLHTPKIQKMVEHILEARKNDPNHRGVVYSNFLESGIHPMSRALTRAGIQHAVFTGEASPAQRAQMVADYNSGKTPLILLSGAGSEGLDLKGTKTIQLMEPHWNQSRIDQTIGRGIRYMSHAHLPEAERKVRVMRYFSDPAKDLDDRMSWMIGRKPKKGIEDYLYNMSKEKGRLTQEIADALQEASDAGPLQKRAARMGLSDEVLQKVIDRMGDSTLGSKGRTRYIEFAHPAGVKIRSPYDANFIRDKVDKEYAGEVRPYADQIRDDLLNMGYATLGSIAKKNEKRRTERAGKGAGYGSLAGVWGPLLVGFALTKKKPLLSGALSSPLATIPGAIIGGTAGWHIGKATYKPLGTGDVTAMNTHPLLMPPKPVKQRVKLDVNER